MNMALREKAWSLHMVFIDDGRVGDNNERWENMEDIIKRNCDLENSMCESIYHSKYGQDKSQSGR